MKRLTHAGTVVSIGQHYSSPDHVRVTVAHGPKKKAKKGAPMPSYDDRPTSELTLPKAHGAQFHIGQRVNVGVGASATSDDGAPLRRTMRGLTSFGKKG